MNLHVDMPTHRGARLQQAVALLVCMPLFIFAAAALAVGAYFLGTISVALVTILLPHSLHSFFLLVFGTVFFVVVEVVCLGGVCFLVGRVWLGRKEG